ncbi:hypothetical protein ACFW2V_41025 [Streptomyces sp. NPDC058947]|uniref:BlaI/MecI/CopY family transcriptional regulator n=1 Tax=Streptomyces sp. R02 TaxID=3238623 RepID=A0AB39LZ65_9ACTN|nr:hypothetical protein [Streptomyces pseudogriseolus]
MEQAASDLEENRRQQQDLTARLDTLRQEERLLLNILSLAEDSPMVPEQAQGEEASSHVPSGSPVNQATAPRPERSGTKRSGSGARRPGKQHRPLLKDLLLDILKGYDEPRHAAELRDELVSKHPDRIPTPQVVRNTLESLVAKGLIERHKQGRSVMYTIVTPGGDVH